MEFISDVPQVLHFGRNTFPGLGSSCHDDIFNFSQCWIFFRRLSNLRQFTRTDWDIDHKTVNNSAQFIFKLGYNGSSQLWSTKDPRLWRNIVLASVGTWQDIGVCACPVTTPIRFTSLIHTCNHVSKVGSSIALRCFLVTSLDRPFRSQV